MSIVLSSNVLCWTFLYMYIYNLYSRTYVGNIDPLKVQRWTMARYQVWSFCDTWWALYVILKFHVFHWNVIIMCWEELNTWLDESPRIIHFVGWIFYVVIWYFAMYAWLFPLQWVMSNVEPEHNISFVTITWINALILTKHIDALIDTKF